VYKNIDEFKKGYLLITELTKGENGGVLADSHISLDARIIYISYWKYMTTGKTKA
jgi:hypothetical protein